VAGANEVEREAERENGTEIAVLLDAMQDETTTTDPHEEIETYSTTGEAVAAVEGEEVTEAIEETEATATEALDKELIKSAKRVPLHHPRRRSQHQISLILYQFLSARGV
jgi:hypothetical protein